MRKAKILAIGNQKGGVAKATTTVHLAAALGELGRKVLIVDLDSNTSSTSRPRRTSPLATSTATRCAPPPRKDGRNMANRFIK